MQNIFVSFWGDRIFFDQWMGITCLWRSDKEWTYVEGDHQEDTSTCWQPPPPAGLRQLEATCPLLCPWNVYSAPSCTSSHFKDTTLRVLLMPSGPYQWLNPVKVSRETQDSGGLMQRSTGLAAAKTKRISTSPCLLKLPPTNLEWSASVFGLPLPSVYGWPVSDFTLGNTPGCKQTS